MPIYTKGDHHLIGTILGLLLLVLAANLIILSYHAYGIFGITKLWNSAPYALFEITKLRNNEPHALFGITKLRNNEPRCSIRNNQTSEYEP